MFEKRTTCTYRKSSMMVVSAATLAFSLGINSSADAGEVLINDHTGLTGITQAVIDDLATDDVADNVYILTSNIDLSPIVVSEEVFTYISGTFRGIFDGNGYNISNLSAPLFDVIGDGSTETIVRNVGLSTTANGITGDASDNKVGILAGEIIGLSSISSVAVSGSISTVASDVAGGLVGAAGYGSAISNSSSSVTIITTGQDAIQGIVGGLVGSGYGVDISNSTSTGSVTSTSGKTYAGGLVGKLEFYSTIVNSSSSTNVTIGGDDQEDGAIGGLVGYMDGESTINSSTASGSVNAISGSDGTGGLVGINSSSGIISNSLASGLVTSATGYAGGLVGFSQGEILDSSATGSVTVDGGEFSITGVGGLVGFASQLVDKSSASGSVTVNSVGDIICVGGLVGCGYGINDSIASGFVDVTSETGAVALVGGLAGANFEFDIDTSSATGDVFVAGNSISDNPAENQIGGLVGLAGNIYDSYATGDVQANGLNTSRIGGLAGQAWGVFNSYATGDVTAETGAMVGGLAGFASEIAQSEASGSVTGLEGEFGLLAGFIDVAIYDSLHTSYLEATDLSGNIGSTFDDEAIVNGLSGDVGPALTPGAQLLSGANLLNVENDPLVWGQNSYINYGLPYILTLRAYGFYHESFPSASVVAAPAAAPVASLNPKFNNEVSTILRLWLYLAGDNSIRITVSDFTVLGVTGVNNANLPILLKLLKGVDLFTLDVNIIKKNVAIADAQLKNKKKK